MWNKLNIDVADANKNSTLVFYYDSTFIKSESEINAAIETLLENKGSMDTAFIIDINLDQYLTKVCKEAFEMGKKQGYTEMKAKLLKEINSL